MGTEAPVAAVEAMEATAPGARPSSRKRGLVPMAPVAAVAAVAAVVRDEGGSTVDGLAGVTARIAEIQSRISALSAPARSAASGAGFSGALAEAVAATSTAGAGPSSATGPAAASGLPRTARASTAMTADGVPLDLAIYDNGKVPAGALSPIGVGGHRLWAPAATAFQQMAAAAARDGVDFGVTDSYRSYEQQVDLAERKGLYSEGGLAAKPGTSDHGWGRSLDLDLDAEALAWMRANGAAHGFIEDTPREPWHWTFTPQA